MKKVFIQFRQLIQKHRKRLIYGALVFFVGQISFFNIGGIGVQNEVFATATENAEQRQQFENIVSEKTKLIDFLRKAVYALVYPILFLAGKLVDNSFVYGEVFGFDVVLWKLWNVVRNLANYGLGFMFIYYIFKYLIGGGRQKNDVKWLITRALVAGIGIQASWFIMAVLIDISTILIYGVGGLPISVLGGDVSSGKTADQDYNPYVMKTIVSVDANDILNMNIYLNNIKEGGGDVYISECDTFTFKYGDGQKLSEEFILAPKMLYYKDEKKTGNQGAQYKKTEEKMCDYYGSVYWFKELVPEIHKAWAVCNGDDDCTNAQTNYTDAKNGIKNKITNKQILDDYINAGQVLRFGKVVTDPEVGLDVDNNWVNAKYGTQRLDQIVKKQDTKSYVGVFTTLYTSLLEAGRGMISVEGQTTYVKFLGGLVALGHVLAISIPLVAALFVLIMRIGIIWMAVVLSPMIVLFTAFSLFDKISDNGSFLKYFEVKNLIGIIFAPAVICFAVSMSTVLVRIIEKFSYEEVLTEKHLIFGGVIQMDIAGFSVGLGKLIVGVMGIAVSWFLVWLAVESSKLGESKFIGSLKGLATDALGAVKFIPVVGKDGQGQLASVNALKNVYEEKKNKIKSEFQTGDAQAVRELFNHSEEEEKAIEKRNNSTVQNFVDGLKTGTITNKWMEGIDVMVDGKKETMKFNEFDGEQKKKIIEKINDLSEDVLKNIGTVTPKIPVSNDVTYVFNGKKFEIENQK